MADAKKDYLDPHHLFEHVQDSTYFHVPRGAGEHIELPQPLKLETPIVSAPPYIEPLDLKLTKFMVLEVVAALIIAILFIWTASRIASARPPRGRMWNLLEALLVYIRDQVARPAIGRHDADRFLPFLWTMFFFILGCNLLGLVPWAGSATGSLATTLALALVTFAVVIGSGMVKLGPVGFWIGQVPHMELPLAIGIFLKPLIFVLEVFGLMIRHGVLAVRLLANMFAGHLVLAVIIAFIAATYEIYVGNVPIWYGVVPMSLFGAVALNLLELFVAFLQAYIFTFLAALFIGMAVHPH